MILYDDPSIAYDSPRWAYDGGTVAPPIPGGGGGGGGPGGFEPWAKRRKPTPPAPKSKAVRERRDVAIALAVLRLLDDLE